LDDRPFIEGFYLDEGLLADAVAAQVKRLHGLPENRYAFGGNAIIAVPLASVVAVVHVVANDVQAYCQWLFTLKADGFLSTLGGLFRKGILRLHLFEVCFEKSF